jgi:hypothetical protein
MKKRISAMLEKFRRYNLVDISTKIGMLTLLSMAVVAPFYGGYDYRVAYRGDTLAGTFMLHSAFPYPASWFIYPFAVLPENIGYLLWNILNAVCFIIALRYWKGNFLSFSFFVGTFWIFYGGQVEGFISGALVLLMSPNPWLAGLGITILTFKPQIGFFPIVFSLVNRKDWKLLVIPGIIYALSFLQWGWWIPGWLANLQTIKNTATVMVTMVSLYPYGLMLVPILWRYRTSLKFWMYVQSLAIPYYPVYSLAPVFTMSTPPIWVSIATWIFYLLLSRNVALIKFAFILPLSLLVYEIWKTERTEIYVESANESI